MRRLKEKFIYFWRAKRDKFVDWLTKRVLVCLCRGSMDCKACGATVGNYWAKIPMKYKGQHIKCPCCGRPMKGRL